MNITKGEEEEYSAPSGTIITTAEQLITPGSTPAESLGETQRPETNSSKEEGAPGTGTV